MLLGLMNEGRPASDVMELIAREEMPFYDALQQAGRNDPCPCGSGQKVKRCHGQIQNAPPPSDLPTYRGEPRPPVIERRK